MDICHGIAVGNNVSAEPPLLSEHVGQQIFAARTGFAVDAVVGSHDGFYMTLLHKHLESRQISLEKVAFGGRDIGLMACGFGTRMHRIMLSAGCHFQIERVVSLHSLHVGGAQCACEKRVFSVSFHAPTPSWVAEDVDVWRPKCKPCVASIVVVALRNVVFCAAFCGNCVANLPD